MKGWWVTTLYKQWRSQHFGQLLEAAGRSFSTSRRRWWRQGVKESQRLTGG